MALSFLALFILFAAVIGTAAMVGTLAYLFSRIRRLEGGDPANQSPGQLTGQMNGIEAELMALQEEVANLSERLDFTEKLLMSGDRDRAGEESE